MSVNKPIRRIAVVGTGVIGASWSAYYLSRGFDVVATDPAPGAEAILRKYVDNAWPALARAGLPAGASRERLTFTADNRLGGWHLGKSWPVCWPGDQRPIRARRPPFVTGQVSGGVWHFCPRSDLATAATLPSRRPHPIQHPSSFGTPRAKGPGIKAVRGPVGQRIPTHAGQLGVACSVRSGRG